MLLVSGCCGHKRARSRLGPGVAWETGKSVFDFPRLPPPDGHPAAASLIARSIAELTRSSSAREAPGPTCLTQPQAGARARGPRFAHNVGGIPSHGTGILHGYSVTCRARESVEGAPTRTGRFEPASHQQLRNRPLPNLPACFFRTRRVASGQRAGRIGGCRTCQTTEPSRVSARFLSASKLIATTGPLPNCQTCRLASCHQTSHHCRRRWPPLATS